MWKENTLCVLFREKNKICKKLHYDYVISDLKQLESSPEIGIDGDDSGYQAMCMFRGLNSSSDLRYTTTFYAGSNNLGEVNMVSNVTEDFTAIFALPQSLTLGDGV